MVVGGVVAFIYYRLTYLPFGGKLLHTVIYPGILVGILAGIFFHYMSRAREGANRTKQEMLTASDNGLTQGEREDGSSNKTKGEQKE